MRGWDGVGMVKIWRGIGRGWGQVSVTVQDSIPDCLRAILDSLSTQVAMVSVGQVW